MVDMDQLYYNFFTLHFEKPQWFVDAVRQYVRYQSQRFKGVLFAGIVNEDSEVLLPLIELDPSVSMLFRGRDPLLRHILDVANLACTQEYRVGTNKARGDTHDKWLLDILRDENRHEVILRRPESDAEAEEQTFFTLPVEVDKELARVNVPKAFLGVQYIDLRKYLPLKLNCRLSKFGAADDDFNLYLLIAAEKRDNVTSDFDDLEIRLLTVAYRAVQELRSALAESQSYTASFLQIHALEQIIDYYLQFEDDESKRLPRALYGGVLAQAHPAVVKKVIRLRANHRSQLRRLLSSVDRTSATSKGSRRLDEIDDYIVRYRPRDDSVPPSRWPRSHEVSTFCITSALGGVGKTSIAYALAYLIARNGKKVCLVETDVTNPSLCYLDAGFAAWVSDRLPLDKAFTFWRNDQLVNALRQRNELVYEASPNLHLLGNSAIVKDNRPLSLARDYTSGLLTAFLMELLRALSKTAYDAVVIDTGGGIRDYAGAVLSIKPDVTFLVSHPNKDSILGALGSTVPYLSERRPTVLLINESFPWDEDLLEDTDALIDYCQLDAHPTIRPLMDSPFFSTSLVPWNPAWKRRVGMLDHTNNLDKIAAMTLEFIDAGKS